MVAVSESPAPGQALAAAAERLDSLADTAELMGDEASAVWLRGEALRRRAHAMHLLDD
jgi:hypothetical protein